MFERELEDTSAFETPPYNLPQPLLLSVSGLLPWKLDQRCSGGDYTEGANQPEILAARAGLFPAPQNSVFVCIHMNDLDEKNQSLSCCFKFYIYF